MSPASSPSMFPSLSSCSSSSHLHFPLHLHACALFVFVFIFISSFSSSAHHSFRQCLHCHLHVSFAVCWALSGRVVSRFRVGFVSQANMTSHDAHLVFYDEERAEEFRGREAVGQGTTERMALCSRLLCDSVGFRMNLLRAFGLGTFQGLAQEVEALAGEEPGEVGFMLRSDHLSGRRLTSVS